MPREDILPTLSARRRVRPGESRGRTARTRSAPACGSSRGAATPGGAIAPLATQCEEETTRSKPERSNDSTARGEERQEVAVVRAARSGRRFSHDARIGWRSIAGETEPGHVEEREDRRLGHERQDRLEDLLAAAHAVQPVVDDGGLRRKSMRRRVATSPVGSRPPRAPPRRP